MTQDFQSWVRARTGLSRNCSQCLSNVPVSDSTLAVNPVSAISIVAGLDLNQRPLGYELP